jgi:predicted enzyme related to lactoylglutathione lyase
MSPLGTQTRWLSYLEVDDVDRRVKEVAANGGKIRREPFDAPGIGRIAMIADATGAAMGWMTRQKL